MLESLLAQKRVLAAYSADHELPTTFTSHQWVLMENILSLLAPFEQLTKDISSSDASGADAIPLIPALKRLLSKDIEMDHGVKTMKSTLLESVNTRFTEIYSDPLHFITTVLDPRYKDHYLDVGIKQRAREMIQATLDAVNPLGAGEVHTQEESRAQKKGLVSLHQIRGMHPRCLICSVKSCKRVPQIIGRLLCSDLLYVTVRYFYFSARHLFLI